MSTGWILKEMNPADLKNHPDNIEIYGTQPLDDEMLASVKEFGIFQPIHCTKDSVVLGGHRRRQHALAGKVKSVPVLMARNAISPEEQVVQIVELNRFREKTMEQKAREYGKLAEAKAILARKRQAAGLKKGLETPVPKNFTEREKGEAKAQAAAEVGMSRPTAEKAAAVVKKIDELTDEGKAQEAAELRDALNKKSVSAAAVKAGVNPPKKSEPKDEPTPFDEPLAGIDWVLNVAVPKIQEHAILAEKALGSGKAGFTADRVSKLVKPIHEAFNGIRGVIANAQQKARRK